MRLYDELKETTRSRTLFSRLQSRISSGLLEWRTGYRPLGQGGSHLVFASCGFRDFGWRQQIFWYPQRSYIVNHKLKGASEAADLWHIIGFYWATIRPLRQPNKLTPDLLSLPISNGFKLNSIGSWLTLSVCLLWLGLWLCLKKVSSKAVVSFMDVDHLNFPELDLWFTAAYPSEEEVNSPEPLPAWSNFRRSRQSVCWAQWFLYL